MLGDFVLRSVRFLDQDYKPNIYSSERSRPT